jgi:urease accessory protein
MKALSVVTVAVAMFILPGSAAAHLVSTRFGELYSGMLHPVTTLQHLVPWLALGLLCGLQTPRTARWALLAFPLAVLAGTGLAGLVPGLPHVDTANILSFVVVGGAVALALRLPAPALLGLVVLVALSHGYANAAAEFRGRDWALYATGVGLAAYLVITLVAGSAHALMTGRPWGSIAVRAVGSWIAAAGAMFLGFLHLVA